jgi:hypothetical protein
MGLPGTHRRGVRAIGVFLKFRSIGLQIVNPGNSVLSQGISKIFVRQASASLDRILVVERRRVALVDRAFYPLTGYRSDARPGQGPFAEEDDFLPKFGGSDRRPDTCPPASDD